MTRVFVPHILKRLRTMAIVEDAAVELVEGRKVTTEQLEHLFSLRAGTVEWVLANARFPAPPPREKVATTREIPRIHQLPPGSPERIDGSVRYKNTKEPTRVLETRRMDTRQWDYASARLVYRRLHTRGMIKELPLTTLEGLWILERTLKHMERAAPFGPSLEGTREAVAAMQRKVRVWNNYHRLPERARGYWRTSIP